MSTLSVRDGVLAAKQRREYTEATKTYPKRLMDRFQAATVTAALKLYATYIKDTLPTNAGKYERTTIASILVIFPTHVPYDFVATGVELPVIFRALIHAYQAAERSELGIAARYLYDAWSKYKFIPPGETGNDRRADRRRRYTGPGAA